VYLPDDLHRQMKARKIKASELFQGAVQAEVERLGKLDALDEYIAELIAEVGEPTAADDAFAVTLADRILGRDAMPEASRAAVPEAS
jgi:post-segregation antitoxin (ccd killing protein)